MILNLLLEVHYERKFSGSLLHIRGAETPGIAFERLRNHNAASKRFGQV